MVAKKKSYADRLTARRRLAKMFGNDGFCTVMTGENAGKHYPKPLMVLLKMKTQED